MPGLSHVPSFNKISITELHPTFGAEISGVEFSRPVEDDVFQEILAAISKYGVCVFRNTGLDDAHHVAFAARFGELDDVTPYLAGGRPHRLSDVRLFDVGNIELDGKVFELDNVRREWNKVCDPSGRSYLARLIDIGQWALPRGLELQPTTGRIFAATRSRASPAGMGGDTEFADLRTAFDRLPRTIQMDLQEQDYIAAHSLWHSRKVASPATFADVDPEAYPMGRHRLFQKHEASGRDTLYLAAHIHHVEGLDADASSTLFNRLFMHATQPRFVLRVGWEHAGDLVLWDNTCVMHRAVGGSFEGKHRRDMRRATVHDGSGGAWGLNERSEIRQGLP